MLLVEINFRNLQIKHVFGKIPYNEYFSRDLVESMCFGLSVEIFKEDINYAPE